MAREITETKDVKTVQSVDFNRQSVSGVKMAQGSVHASVVKSSTEHDTTDHASVTFDLEGLTVQGAIDQLEAFTGGSVDLSSLTFEDFVHSVIHERS